MIQKAQIRRWSLFGTVAVVCTLAVPRSAGAQGFISPSFGYDFGGDSGCLTATNCENKNWNWGVSFGAVGSVVGFETEFTYESEFTGSTPNQKSALTTFMANFMLAPKISIVQPYGLGGIGLIRTDVDNKLFGSSQAQNQIGWTVGGGLMVFVQQHIGIKGDIR